jgi:hypothetical protein
VQLHRPAWALALFALAATIAIGLANRSHRPFPQASALPLTRGIITNAFVESGYDFRRRYTASWFHAPNQIIGTFHRNPTGGIDVLQLDLAQPNAPSVHHPAALDDHETRPLTYWTISPDGRWLLTVRRLRESRLYQVYQSDHSLAGSWTNRYEGRSQPDWLNNSSGFVEWPIRDGRLLARVHWLDTDQPTEVQLDSLPAHVLRRPDPLPQPCVPLLFSSLSSDIAAEFLILSPDRHPANWRRAILDIPEPLRHLDRTSVALSPTADHLAWLCETTARLPRLTFSRVPPFLEIRPRHRTSLFVSRPDGSQLTFLGRTHPGTTFPAIRWSTAGDHLTFLYQDSLWLQRLPTPAHH